MILPLVFLGTVQLLYTLYLRQSSFPACYNILWAAAQRCPYRSSEGFQITEGKQAFLHVNTYLSSWLRSLKRRNKQKKKNKKKKKPKRYKTPLVKEKNNSTTRCTLFTDHMTANKNKQGKKTRSSHTIKLIFHTQWYDDAIWAGIIRVCDQSRILLPFHILQASSLTQSRNDRPNEGRSDAAKKLRCQVHIDQLIKLHCRGTDSLYKSNRRASLLLSL